MAILRPLRFSAWTYSNRAVKSVLCGPGSRICSPRRKIVQYEMIILPAHSLEIIKLFVTRCQIFTIKCTKFDFGWGFTLDHTGELSAYSAPQTS